MCIAYAAWELKTFWNDVQAGAQHSVVCPPPPENIGVLANRRLYKYVQRKQNITTAVKASMLAPELSI